MGGNDMSKSEFYKVSEVAQILGTSEGAVGQRLIRKQIPFTKLGKSVLIPRVEFDAQVRKLLISARR
jgi:excisionase family DNA binding protein